MNEELAKTLGKQLTDTMIDSMKDASNELAIGILHEILDEIRKDLAINLGQRKDQILQELTKESINGSLWIRIRNRVYAYMIQNTDFVDKIANDLVNSLEEGLKESMQKKA